MCHLCFSLEDQSRLEVMKTRLHRNGHAASSSELRWDESFHRRDQFGLRARLVGVRQKAREQAKSRQKRAYPVYEVDAGVVR